MNKQSTKPDKETARLFLVFGVLWLLCQTQSIGSGIGGILMLVVLGLCCLRCLPSRDTLLPVSGREMLVGVCLSFSLVLFFSFHLFDTVPLGFSPETIRFLRFALRLVEDGFPYKPYSWYSHTLFSYVIGFVTLFVESHLLAYRVASLCVSLCTIVFFYLFVKSAAGRQAAWISTSLLAVSSWSLWISRVGSGQVLVPLFHCLFMYALIRGVQTIRYKWFVLAAVAMVLGLHSYWGFYIMPFVWLLCICWTFLWSGDSRGRFIWPFVFSFGLAVLLSIPLLMYLYDWPRPFPNIEQALSPSHFGATGYLSKAFMVLDRIFSYLSLPSGYSRNSRVITPLLAALAFLGAIESIRRVRRSLPCLYVITLFSVYVGALLIAQKSHCPHYALKGLIIPIYFFAGLGLQVLAGQFFIALPFRCRSLAFVFTLVLIGVEARNNYDMFFRKPVRCFTEPYDESGQLFLLMRYMKEREPASVTYIARDRPSGNLRNIHDGEQLYHHYRFRYNDFHFLHSIHWLPRKQIFFWPDSSRRAVESLFFLHDQSSLQAIDARLDELKILYPNMTRMFEYAPWSYRKNYPAPVFERVLIPEKDVSDRFGLRRAALSSERAEWVGVFSVRESNLYKFVSKCDGETSFFLNGQRVPLVRSSRVRKNAFAVPLAEGLHDVRIKSREVSPEKCFHYDYGGKQNTPLSQSLFHFAPGTKERFSSYFAGPSEYSVFDYQLKRRIPFAFTDLRHVRGAFSEAKNSVLVTYGSAAVRYSVGERLRSLEDTARWRGSFRLRIMGKRPLLFSWQGELYSTVEDQLKELGRFSCSPRDIAPSKGRIYVLCRNGGVRVWKQGRERLLPLRYPAVMNRTRADSLDVYRERVYLLDRQYGHLFVFNKRTGEMEEDRVIESRSEHSVVRVDNEGNVYVTDSGIAGIQAFSRDGSLLFHPRFKVSSVFVTDDGKPFRGDLTGLLFTQDGKAVGVERKSNSVLVFKRRQIVRKSSQGLVDK